jgi:hypothetical protein
MVYPIATSKAVTVTLIQPWCASHKTTIGSKAHHNTLETFDHKEQPI